METEFSKPLKELPAFLSTISMVVDDRSAIVQSLVHAERKAPPRYEPARNLFCRVLDGSFSFDQAIDQATKLSDDVERKCAFDILSASEKYLRTESHGRIGRFPAMSFSFPNGLDLGISPIWIRHLGPDRLMVLHFWQQSLSEWQMAAAAAVLKRALSLHWQEYSQCELDFISVPLPEFASRRRFELYDWRKLKPLGDKDFDRFWKQFFSAWAEYQLRGPRKFRRKRNPDMFSQPIT